MKRTVLCAVTIGVLASAVMAAPTLSQLAPFSVGAANTASEGRAITPDGKYIVGNSTGGAAQGTFWDATDPTAPVARDILGGGARATAATGIGYRTTATGATQVLVHGLSAGYSTVWPSQDGGLSFLSRSRDSSVGGSPQLPGANTLGSQLGSDIAYVSWYNGSAGNNLYLDQHAGDPIVLTHSVKGTSTTSAVQGVSATGRQVGRRRDVNAIYQNYIIDWNGTGTGTAYFVNGLAGDTRGEAWAVSQDGTKVFGLSPVSDGRSGNWPYMRDMVNNTIIELPTAANTGGSVTNGIVYGASADGRYAVGMNYRGVEKAVLWDTQTGHMVDLTKFAAANGILGDFTGNLRRAYSVGVNDEGYPVVTGMGVTPAGTRGFVMVVPEPATLAFVAFGGLALLRRRR